MLEAITDKPRRSDRKPLAVSVEDASRLTSLGRSTVAELISQGKLKTVAIGRRRVVLYASIEALLQIDHDLAA